VRPLGLPESYFLNISFLNKENINRDKLLAQ
jgi:hypothetical protein